MPPVSPRSGGGTPRLIRGGEPTGLVPRGPGAKGGSRPLAFPEPGQAAADGGRAPSLESLLTQKEMLTLIDFLASML